MGSSGAPSRAGNQHASWSLRSPEAGFMQARRFWAGTVLLPRVLLDFHTSSIHFIPYTLDLRRV